MAINSISMSFIILPVSIINISISMNQSSLSISFTVFPPAFIHRAIWPYLSSLTLTNICSNHPFTFIFGSIFKNNNLSLFTISQFFLNVSIIKISHLCSQLLNFRIIIIDLAVVARSVDTNCCNYFLYSLSS